MGAPVLSLWGDANAYKEGRAYKNPFTDERLPSVTTILKMADKGGLAQWAADKAMEWAVVNWSLLGQRSDEDALKAGRYRWKDVRDERAEVGTGVHETVEAIHTGSDVRPFLDDEQDRIMERFDEFNFVHHVVPVYTEFTVWSPDAYAGTADGLWLIDGELWLIDVKTSKNIWPEHFCQLAALRHAPLALIRVPEGTEDAVPHKDKEKNISWWVQIDNPALQADKVGILHLREDKWELVQVENLELHQAKFDGYAQVHSATQKLKAIEAAKEKAAKAAEKEKEIISA